MKNIIIILGVLIVGVSSFAKPSVETCQNASVSVVGETHQMVGPVFVFHFDGRDFFSTYIDAAIGLGEVMVSNDKIESIEQMPNGDNIFHVSRSVLLRDPSGLVVLSSTLNCIGINFNSVEILDQIRGKN